MTLDLFHSLFFKSKRIQFICCQPFRIHAYNKVEHSEPMVTIDASGTAKHKTFFICLQIELKCPLTAVLQLEVIWALFIVGAEKAAHY